MEKLNARIESTSLGTNDAPCMNCWLFLEFDGTGQGFGGYAMDEWSPAKRIRVGTAYGLQFIMDLLEVVGVSQWEDLRGKYVRVEREDGLGGRIIRIGHITKDQWFDPAALLESMK